MCRRVIQPKVTAALAAQLSFDPQIASRSTRPERTVTPGEGLLAIRSSPKVSYPGDAWFRSQHSGSFPDTENPSASNTPTARPWPWRASGHSGTRTAPTRRCAPYSPLPPTPWSPATTTECQS